MYTMKTVYELPDNVDKPCGTKPGPDNETFVLSLDLDDCENPASYVVEVDGKELLVCGTHRKTIQDKNAVEYPEVVSE